MKLRSSKLFLWFLFIILAISGIVYLTLERPEEWRYQKFCRTQMLQIWKAMENYRAETGNFPDTLDKLENRVDVRCPYSRENYVYEKPGKGTPQPVLWDRTTVSGHKRNILFSDGKLYMETDPRKNAMP